VHWKVFHGVQVLHLVLAISAAVGFFVFWARTRFWLPKYVHFLALIALALGLWCVANVPGDAPISGYDPITKVLMALVLPAMVYFFFVFYGGQSAAFRRTHRIPVPCPYCKRQVTAFRDESGDTVKVVFEVPRCPHCGQGLE
jgi:hypothetical protein